MFFDVYKHDKCIIYYDLDDEQHVELDEENKPAENWQYSKNSQPIINKDDKQQ